MKYFFLLLSCAILLSLSTSCQKAGQIHSLSAHTWVVSDQTTLGFIGDEYTFYDNRLYTQSGSTIDDGQWDFDNNDLNRINVSSDLNNTTYTVLLSANQLELIPTSFGFGKMILLPKK